MTQRAMQACGLRHDERGALLRVAAAVLQLSVAARAAGAAREAAGYALAQYKDKDMDTVTADDVGGGVSLDVSRATDSKGYIPSLEFVSM